MDFLTAVKVVLRRWYVFLPVLGVAIVVTLAVVSSVPPSYLATGSVIVASPGAPRDPGEPVQAANPLRNLDYSAGVVATIIAGLMQDRLVKEGLVEAGASPDYTLGIPTGSNTPLLGVEATASTPEQAVDTVNLVIKGIQDQLGRRQADAGAPPETWIRAIVLTSPSDAERQSGGKLKAAGALGAIGLLAAASMAFITESIAVGRRRQVDEPHARPGPGGLRPAAGDDGGSPVAGTPATG